MATEEEIAAALAAVLRESAAAGPTTTFNDVVGQLQSKLGGLDVSHKLDFIRSHIQFLFQSQSQTPQHFPINPNFQSNSSSPSAFHSFPPPNHVSVSLPHPPHQQPVNSSPPGKPDANFANVSLPDSPKQGAPAKVKRKGGTGGLNKICSVSPELQAIVGQPALPRTEIVKQLWAYIRKHNLQDPNNKRKIICNDELRIVFETDCTDMFKMNKLLAKHISPLEPTKSQMKKQKTDAEPTTADSPVQISEALANFFGVSEREMPRSDITKRIWEYIGVNQLQEPNTTTILCDTKLQEIFGCESIRALDIPGVLGQHLVGRT